MDSSPTGGGYVFDKYRGPNLTTRTSTGDEFRAVNQRFVDALAWLLPILAAIDLARLFLGGWGFQPGWLGYFVIGAIVYRQRRTRNPDLTILVIAAAVWVATFSLLYGFDILDGPRDEAAEPVVLVVFGLVLMAMSRHSPLRVGIAYGVSNAAWVVLITVAVGLPASATFFRAAIISAAYAMAGWLVADVRRGLLAARQRRNQSTKLYEALSVCARSLLHGGDDDDLQRALEALLGATSATSVFVEVNVDDPVLGLCSSLVWERGYDISPAQEWELIPYTDQPMA